MSFGRGLAVFILSIVFISSLFAAVTLFSIGSFLQKDSMGGFIAGEGVRLGAQSCQEQCDSEECESECNSAISSQLSSGVGEAVDELYSRRFFGVSMSDVLSFQLMAIMAILSAASGALVVFASKKPLATIGKDMAVSSMSVFAVPVVLVIILSSVSIPFDLGESFLTYVSAGLSNQAFFGLALLLAGILLILLNCATKRKRKN